MIPLERQLFSTQILNFTQREPFIMPVSIPTKYFPAMPFYALTDINFIPLDAALEKNRLIMLPPNLRHNKFILRPEKRIRVNKKGIVVALKLHSKPVTTFINDTLWGEDWCLEGEHFNCVPKWAQKYFDDKDSYGGCHSFDHLEKIIPAKIDTIVALTVEPETDVDYIKVTNEEVYVALIWHFQSLMKDKRLCLLTGNELFNMNPYGTVRYFDTDGNIKGFSLYGFEGLKYDSKTFMVVSGKIISR